MKKLKKIMIANRGEIALRVIRSARKLGISTLALVTRAEHNAQHAKLADECHVIGDGPAPQSYLNPSLLVDVALKRGADAIHPGYGFLSENFDFVKKIEESGINFIGPHSEAMRKVGNKKRAKEIMSTNDVPLIPGYHGESQEDGYLKEQADKIGYPMLIKAAQGGGGKGMRLVTESGKFLEMLKSAREEAMSNFGADRVILERFIQNPKHIEVQILGDKFGNVFDFFERDCSVQRRHQKIIEEAPSALPANLSAAIRATAVRAARAAGYSNAGTVEFLFDPVSSQYYFMEMNSRLQVEHPVSELVTGHDLVELQIRVAQGENLSGLTLPSKPRGHAMEARLCAEDPFNGFMPSTGTISRLEFLGRGVTSSDLTMGFDLSKTSIDEISAGKARQTGERRPIYDVRDQTSVDWTSDFPGDEIFKTNIRLDSGVISGSTVTPFYDSMIGKVIVWGEDRAAALQLLEKALRSVKVSGVQTTLPFLLNLVNEKDFRDFNYYLEYFPTHVAQLTVDPLSDAEARARLAGFVLRSMFGSSEFPSALANFRLNTTCSKLFRLSLQKTYSLDSAPRKAVIVATQTSVGSNNFALSVELDGKKSEHLIEFVSADRSSVAFNIDGEVRRFTFENAGEFFHEGLSYQIKDISLEPIFSQKQDAALIFEATMDAQLREVNVKDGDVVEAGTWLYSTYSMKTEHKAFAKSKLKVTKVHFAAGDFVEKGKSIISVEAIDQPAKP